MQQKKSDWYKNCWDLGIKNASWVESTESQVDFIIETLDLHGRERILDLACGYGRHSLEFARRGYKVVGIDITPDYVVDAQKTAAEENLNAEFFLGDIRSIDFEDTFDVVINMADGAIGYLENNVENEKIFAIAARALRKGGKHFIDIGNADYADSHFPQRLWDSGEKSLTLSVFEWNRESRILLYGQTDISYGTNLQRFEFADGDPIRLYSVSELSSIYQKLGMNITASFADFTKHPASASIYQMEVVAQKL